MPAPDQVTLPTPCAHGCGRGADAGCAWGHVQGGVWWGSSHTQGHPGGVRGFCRASLSLRIERTSY